MKNGILSLFPKISISKVVANPSQEIASQMDGELV